MGFKRTVGFTCGSFDLIHPGHIVMFEDAKHQCGYLIVGLQTDPTIDRPDIKHKPIQSLEERRIQLEAVKYIDEIFTYDTEEELYKKLLDINPDVRILGSDYIGKSFTGDDLDIKIYYHDRNHNYSTTNLREKIVSEHIHREATKR